MQKYKIIFSVLLNAILMHKLSATEQKFDIAVKNVPITNIIEGVTMQNNIDIIMNDDITGNISLKLLNTDIKQLLQVIAKIKKLDLAFENNIYYLSNKSTSKNLSSKDSIDGQSSDSALLTATIRIYNLKSEEMLKILTSDNTSLLSSQGKITNDSQGNNIIVQDTNSSINNIKQIIKKLDVATPQVMIEARIVSINSDNLKELGVRWGLLEGNAGLRAKLNSGSVDVGNNLSVNFPADVTAGSLAFNITKISNIFLDLELTAIEKENNAKIIASPKLLTINKQKASIKQGTEIPYVVTSQNGTENVEFREAVLGLEAIPQIRSNNELLLELNISHNAPGFLTAGNNQMTTINKQEIKTQIIAKDGETIVLGGIYQQSQSNNINGIPVLNKIPIIKNLFSKNSTQHQKRELVIFVTPHIIKK